jgi:hypothetical protein
MKAELGAAQASPAAGARVTVEFAGSRGFSGRCAAVRRAAATEIGRAGAAAALAVATRGRGGGRDWRD